MADAEDSDEGMDALMDKFKTERYKNGFSENTWEEVRLTCRNYRLSTLEKTLFIRK